jgi:putative heme-binding domain-containing protein
MRRDRSSSRRLRWVALVAILVARPLAAQDHAGQYAQADVQYGSAIYTAQCIPCHGAAGDQVGGVNLRSGRFRRASSDDELRGILTTGIAGTGMPAFKFDPAELVGIVAYLRNMDAVDRKAVTIGDGRRGQAIVEGAGACLTCHRVNGMGALKGPNLSEIGRVRPASALEASILDPNGAMLPVNRSVRVVTKDGRTITGRRLNEDTYMVLLIDQESERLMSFAKADISEFRVLTTSSMPAYKGKLSSSELADVVAYLLSLKGPKS